MILVAAYVLGERLGITLTSNGFLALVIAFGAIELAFVPLVLGPFISSEAWRGRRGGRAARMGARHSRRRCSHRSRRGSRLFRQRPGTLWLWAAVPACLVTGAVLFALARLRSATTAA